MHILPAAICVVCIRHSLVVSAPTLGNRSVMVCCLWVGDFSLSVFTVLCCISQSLVDCIHVYNLNMIFV